MLGKYANKNRINELSQDELLKIYENLFDNAYDIILLLSEDGGIISANKIAIEKYGYSYDELSSMNIQTLRHSSMDSNYIDQMVLSECEGVVFEGVHVRKDGSLFPVEVSSRTITFNDNKFRIHIIRDTTERKKVESKILHLANYDTLTNIANRANIISQLDESIRKAKITGNDLAFIVFDLDKFKLVNDTFGHPIGDKVLQYVAQNINKSLRAVDTIGRFGGDEFVIIQRNINSKNDVVSLINRIFIIFEHPIKIEINNIKINISIGVSLLSEAATREQLINEADAAMYEAKKIQGCSYQFYSNIKG